MSYLYFDTNHAIKQQDFIIENSGGRKGVINIGLVDSVLEHIQNDSYYPEFENKVCHLFYSINKIMLLKMEINVHLLCCQLILLK
jgi:death-on-curing protein